MLARTDRAQNVAFPCWPVADAEAVARWRAVSDPGQIGQRAQSSLLPLCGSLPLPGLVVVGAVVDVARVVVVDVVGGGGGGAAVVRGGAGGGAAAVVTGGGDVVVDTVAATSGDETMAGAMVVVGTSTATSVPVVQISVSSETLTGPCPR